MVVSEHQSLGAVESYAIQLAKGLSERGHSVILAALSSVEDEFLEEVKTLDHVPIDPDPKRRFQDALRLVASFRPEVVHVNADTSPPLVAAGLKGVRARVVTDHVLPLHTRYNLRGSLLRQATVMSANSLIVFSHQNAQAATTSWRRIPAKVIYPGVRISGTREKGERSLHELGIDSHRLVITTTGGLRPEKRFDVFIRAIYEIHRRGTQVHGLILGDGEQRGDLENLIQSLEIQESITLAGHRSDVGSLLEVSDIYVQSSAREGICFALLEAMAAGKPAVISDIPALREALGPVSVPVAPVGSHMKLATGVLSLIANDQRRVELGRALRDRWRESFSVLKMVKEHEEIYLGQLAKSDRG